MVFPFSKIWKQVGRIVGRIWECQNLGMEGSGNGKIWRLE